MEFLVDLGDLLLNAVFVNFKLYVIYLVVNINQKSCKLENHKKIRKCEKRVASKHIFLSSNPINAKP